VLALAQYFFYLSYLFLGKEKVIPEEEDDYSPFSNKNKRSASAKKDVGASQCKNVSDKEITKFETHRESSQGGSRNE